MTCFGDNNTRFSHHPARQLTNRFGCHGNKRILLVCFVVKEATRNK